jgi:hypothetical protein
MKLAEGDDSCREARRIVAALIEPQAAKPRRKRR